MINYLHKLMVLLSKNYLIQCTTCMKSVSVNSYFIALIAFKIQNLIIFNHQFCLPLFASSQEIAFPWDMDGQSPKLIFSTSIILIILLPKSEYLQATTLLLFH